MALWLFQTTNQQSINQSTNQISPGPILPGPQGTFLTIPGLHSGLVDITLWLLRLLAAGDRPNLPGNPGRFVNELFEISISYHIVILRSALTCINYIPKSSWCIHRWLHVSAWVQWIHWDEFRYSTITANHSDVPRHTSAAGRARQWPKSFSSGKFLRILLWINIGYMSVNKNHRYNYYDILLI